MWRDGFHYWIKRWQTCKSSFHFDLLRQTCCFCTHPSPSLMRSEHNASLVLEDNAIQLQREAGRAQYCALCDRRVSFQPTLALQVVLQRMAFWFLQLTFERLRNCTWCSASHPSMWEMHNCNNHAQRENCNHVITFPTVRLIEFKVPLGLWFLTAGR